MIKIKFPLSICRYREINIERERDYPIYILITKLLRKLNINVLYLNNDKNKDNYFKNSVIMHVDDIGVLYAINTSGDIG